MCFTTESDHKITTQKSYTCTREGEVPPLGNGPKPCRLGLGVRKGSPPFDR